jgi:hypothetical protein
VSLGNGRVSRVEGHSARVEGHRSSIKSRSPGSKVEVDGQKSRSRVKSRASKFNGRKWEILLFFINTFLEYYIFGICCQN